MIYEYLAAFILVTPLQLQQGRVGVKYSVVDELWFGISNQPLDFPQIHHHRRQLEAWHILVSAKPALLVKPQVLSFCLISLPFGYKMLVWINVSGCKFAFSRADEATWAIRAQ
jgi:hypothetical protein